MPPERSKCWKRPAQLLPMPTPSPKTFVASRRPSRWNVPQETWKQPAVLPTNLPRYPTSLFLRNEAAKVGSPIKPAGPELDRHLAADTNRLLNLVLRYNRLGLYADSLELLNRN